MVKMPPTPYSPAPDQLKLALEDVAYEMEQLLGTCRHFVVYGTGPEVATPETEHDVLTANVYLESLLLHVRVLLHFFERTKRSVRNGDELDDVLGQDYGFPARKVEIERSLRVRINQDLTHLSYSRTTRQGVQRNWHIETMAAPLLERSAQFAEYALETMTLGTEVRERFTVVRRLIAGLLAPLETQALAWGDASTAS